MGAMGVEAGTNGTIQFDGFSSRRLAVDSIFSDSFESDGISLIPAGWSVVGEYPDHPNLSSEATYWGTHGLVVNIDNANGLYVQDYSPQAERQYHARFYLNPNQVTIGSGSSLDVFEGWTYTPNEMLVCRVQMQQSGGVYRVRIGSLSDSNWVDSAWYDLADGWNAIEIAYLPGYQTGEMSLWVGGELKNSLTGIDNNDSTIDTVLLGAMSEFTGMQGSLFIDDFDSRRYSTIGLLADPGAAIEPGEPQPNWNYTDYTYTNETPHAVTALSTGELFDYDDNGNMTYREEDGKAYIQSYNAENRLFNVEAWENETFLDWYFSYDGDGNLVRQMYFETAPGQAVTVKVSNYFIGGAYEVDQSGVLQEDETILITGTVTRQVLRLRRAERGDGGWGWAEILPDGSPRFDHHGDGCDRRGSVAAKVLSLWRGEGFN